MLEKIRRHFSNPINKKAASITALVLIVLAIPLTVFISQQQQELRQRAQEISPQGGGYPFGKAVLLKNLVYSDNNFIGVSRRFTLDSNYTIEFWVKLDDRQNFNNQTLFRMGRNLGVFTESGSSGTENKLALITSEGTTNRPLVGPELELGIWHHIAITFTRGSQNQGTVGMHLDGNTIASREMPFVDEQYIFEVGESLYNGTIDEFRTSNNVRYPQDSTTYPMPTSPFTPDANTLILFNFNDNTNDSSGNENNGHANGSIQFVDSAIGGGPSEGISLALSPTTQNATVGSPFNAQLSLNAGSNNITGVDVTVRYNKDILELTSFTPTDAFNTQLINNIDNQAGTLRYSAVNTQEGVVRAVPLGTIAFLARTEGTSPVTFDNIQITALGQTGSLPTSNNQTGSYTVNVPTATSAPLPTSTPEPIASCSTLYNRIVRAMGKSCGVETYDSVADLNRDRRVSNTDYSLYLVDSDNGTRAAVCDNYLSSTVNPCAASPSASPSPVLGDANGDGSVDILDFNIWRDEFTGRAQTRRADFNRDGRVDLLDFAIWRNAFGGTSPTPTSPPQASAKRVFLTSTTYNGNLGGLAGADSKCQARADAVNLGGRWKAWLSSGTSSAASRLTHNNGPYKLLDGQTVVNNWADLTDGTLQNPINITELNTIPRYQSCVWTSTRTDGSFVPSVSNVTGCNSYTIAADTIYSWCGMNGRADFNWTNWESTDRCDQVHPVYCFEQ